MGTAERRRGRGHVIRDRVRPVLRWIDAVDVLERALDELGDTRPRAGGRLVVAAVHDAPAGSAAPSAASGTLHPDRPGEGSRVPVRVMVVEELGSDAYAYAYGNLHLGPEAGVPDDKMFIARVDARRPPPKGETIHLHIRKSEEHVFNPETGGARKPRRSLPRQPLTVTRLGRARAPCGADRRGQVMALQPHPLIIVGVLMLLFGAKRLPEAARGLGRSTRILRSEIGSIGSDSAAETDVDIPKSRAPGDLIYGPPAS